MQMKTNSNWMNIPLVESIKSILNKWLKNTQNIIYIRCSTGYNVVTEILFGY